jgi:hypothetical protein
MATSDIWNSAIKNLPLGDNVHTDIVNCFQDWRAATCDAIFSAPEPEDENANTEWWIAILGNMAWAATVMFPPALAVVGVSQVAAEAGLVIATAAREETTITRAVVAGASAATKAVSFLGAAAGSGIYAKVREYRGKIKADGKDYIRHYVLSQIPRLQSSYIDVADAFIRNDLLDYLIMFADKRKMDKGDKKELTEDDFFNTTGARKVRTTGIEWSGICSYSQTLLRHLTADKTDWRIFFRES